MLKRVAFILLSLLLLLVAVACSPDEPDDPEIPEVTLVLIQNGLSDYVIVYPENATETDLKAASELQSYLKEISGVELPMRTDAEPAIASEIVVGYTNRSGAGQFDTDKLGHEGFAIESVGQRIFIAGSGVRGALYGVYTFLEEYLGCRFYASDFEKIPKSDSVSVKEIKRNEQIPAFEYREIDFVTSRQNDFQPKLKANGMYNNSDAAYGGKIDYVGGFVHTIEQWMPREQYPQYYGVLEDGTHYTGWGAQPCLSNPEVLAFIKNKVRALLEEHPDAKIISVSQPDSGTLQLPCMCENCKRIYAEEGAYSGAMIRFVNAIANEFAADYPELKIDTLAYHHTRSVCKTPPAPNVIVRFCTIECCFSHPLGTCKDVYAMNGNTKTISQDIADWGKVCKNIYVWDYVTNFVESVTFFPNFDVLLPNVQFFAKNNVVGVYEEGNFFSETCDFPELRSYIMAKLLWNPNMSEAQYWGYIDEFLRDYYGEGWQHIRAYIDLGRSIVEKKHFGIHDKFSKTIYAYTSGKKDRALLNELTLDMLRNYESVDWERFFTYSGTVVESELVTRGFELFDAAAAVATPEQATRIAKLRLIPEFAHSYALYESYCNAKPSKVIEDLLFDFFLETSEGRKVNATERAELSENLRNYICERYNVEQEQAYENYNRDLFARALTYRIHQLYEGMPYVVSVDDPNLNFKTTPDNWRPKN